jgi:hypothetical protein
MLLILALGRILVIGDAGRKEEGTREKGKIFSVCMSAYRQKYDINGGRLSRVSLYVDFTGKTHTHTHEDTDKLPPATTEKAAVIARPNRSLECDMSLTVVTDKTT